MKKRVLLVVLGLFTVASTCTAPLSAGNAVNDRVVSAAIALKDIAEKPKDSIPRDLLDNCSCVAIIPSVKKAGFLFGASYGRGLVSCRTNTGDGAWSAPSMLALEGGSFGFQIGAQSVDLILVIMNLSGLQSLLSSKFTLGGDVSVSAGPVGLTAAAETDALMKATIYAYSNSRGLFGGITVKAGTLRPDKEANIVLYGKEVEPKSILFTAPESVPKDVKILLDQLTALSPKKAQKSEAAPAKTDK
jgi:lipid-binding SYLF domain-containing protein